MTISANHRDKSPMSASGQPPARFPSTFPDDGTRQYQAPDQSVHESSGVRCGGGPAFEPPSRQMSYPSDMTDNASVGGAGGGGLQQYQHQPQLGSQSTLASDRGGSTTGAARLVLTSHDPSHYSNQSSVSRVSGEASSMTPAASGMSTGGGGGGGGASGGGSSTSPIWKRRYGGRGGPSSSSHHSPASNDDAARDSDGSGGDGGTMNAPPPKEFQKQRVTFRIPPSAYIETEDTDC